MLNYSSWTTTRNRRRATAEDVSYQIDGIADVGTAITIGVSTANRDRRRTATKDIGN
jgi:hypothetical protein